MSGWKDDPWNDGSWKDGSWKDGSWKDGSWKDGSWKVGMNWNHSVRRALETNLELICIYANIAQQAPLNIAMQMLHLIGDETLDAAHWLGMLATMSGSAMPPGHPDCGFPFASEKEEE